MSGQIFISYRREDSLGSTGRMYDRLTRHFTQEQIFMDVDTIPPGEDFVEYIERAVGKCDVLIAVIGKDWVQSKDQHGRRRLDDPSDFVRTEIRAALQRKIRVIPVLVENAGMPSADDLPDDIKPLRRRNYIELSHTRFNMDADRLVKSLQKVLEEAETRAKEKAEQERMKQAQWEAQQKEETAWAIAAGENSITAYQNYVTAYPTGKYATEGQKRKAALLQQAEEKEKQERFDEHYRTGMQALKRQQYAKALSSFIEAEKILPAHEECQERIAECTRQIEIQHKENEEKEAAQQRAEAEARLKKVQEAQQQLEQERLAKEKAAEVQLQRWEQQADELKNTGKYAAALRLYEQVLNRQPTRLHSLEEAEKCKAAIQREKEQITGSQPQSLISENISGEKPNKPFNVWLFAGGAAAVILLLVIYFTANDKGRDTASDSGVGSTTDYTTTTDTALSPAKQVINSILQNMVAISGGSFTLGTNSSDNEAPAHTVSVESFLLSKYEVTREQWNGLMGDYKYTTALQAPATNVSWEDVQSFINTLNAQSGKRFRLPTESEWEYVCLRGYGDDYRQDLNRYSWNRNNANDSLHPVGVNAPNAFGIYDMLGNAYEWCADSYGKYRGSKDEKLKVLRGGDYKINTYFLSPKIRNMHERTGSSETIGFRLAMDNGNDYK